MPDGCVLHYIWGSHRFCTRPTLELVMSSCRPAFVPVLCVSFNVTLQTSCGVVNFVVGKCRPIGRFTKRGGGLACLARSNSLRRLVCSCLFVWSICFELACAPALFFIHVRASSIFPAPCARVRAVVAIVMTAQRKWENGRGAKFFQHDSLSPDL